MKSSLKKALLALASCLAVLSASAQRDPMKWPYARTSVWNMPLHTSAQYVPAGIGAATGWGFGDDDIHIIARPTAPSRNVYKLVQQNDRYWTNRCERAAGNPVAFAAPIPASYTYYHPTHNDIFAVFTDNGHFIESLPMQYCNDLGQWTTMWNSNVEDVTGDGLFSGTQGGSHLTALGGTIRVGELRPGSEIRHALKILVNCGKYAYYRASEPDGKSGYRWPANSADAYAATGYGGTNPEMQMGALVALKPDFNVSTLRTEPARIIARALQNYGAYLVDDTGWDTYLFETEDGPDGNVRAQVLDSWNVKWNEQSTVSGGQRADCNQPSWDWVRDMATVMTNLNVVKNNAPTTIGGGPTSDETNRRAAMACAFGAAGSGGTCPSTPAPVSGFEGTYTLTARHSGKRLDVSGNSTADGGRVIQWTANGAPNQQWQVSATGNGYYKLIAQHSGKALDVKSSGETNGVLVQQYRDNNTGAQRWKIEPTDGGYYKLTNQTSGKVLDVDTKDDTQVHQWDYVGGANQQWKLDLVSSSSARAFAAASLAATPALFDDPAAASLLAYPNPSPNGRATLRLTAHAPQTATVYVHDQQGQLVSLLTVPVAGQTDFRLPGTLPTGTYYLHTKLDGKAQRFTIEVE